MNFRTTILVSFLTLLGFLSSAQEEEILLKQLLEEEQNIAEAIALYPAEKRAIILEAAAHPEILVRMQQIRLQTEKEFKQLLGPLPEEEQKKLYDLARYPELIGNIISGYEKKSRDEMEKLLFEYPDEVKENALFANNRQLPLLVKINELYQSSDQAFETLLGGYPDQTRNAYNELVALPEVVSILNEDMTMTVLLGDIYKKDPQMLKKKLDSLNIVVAEEKSRELQEWKKKLEEDPEAIAEYEAAAREFAREQGYSETEYSEPIPESHTTNIYVQHQWQPYPYWFGTPSWYAYDYWYPYPWWYHWGYYYRPGGVIVFVGLPSYHFIHWHLNQYHHFYHYPHFTDRVVSYYYGHRKSRNSVTNGVETWMENNRQELPKKLLEDDKNRVERIKEFGEFKVDYQTAVRRTEEKAPDQQEYLRKNISKYPTLKPVLEEMPKTATAKPEISEPVKRQPPVSPPAKPKVPETRAYPKTEIEKKRPDYQEVDRAKDYHRNTWKEIKPKPQPQPQRVTPPRKVETRPLPRPDAPRKAVPKPSPKKTKPDSDSQ